MSLLTFRLYPFLDLKENLQQQFSCTPKVISVPTNQSRASDLLNKDTFLLYQNTEHGAFLGLRFHSSIYF